MIQERKNRDGNYIEKFVNLDEQQQKHQLKYYLLLRIQLIIVILTSGSSGLLSLLVLPNYSVCLQYPIFTNFTLRNLMLTQTIIQSSWFIFCAIFMLKFVSKRDLRVQKFCYVLSVINSLYFILRLVLFATFSYVFYTWQSMHKCNIFSQAVFYFLNYCWYVGIFAGIVHLCLLMTNKFNRKFLKELTCLQTEKQLLRDQKTQIKTQFRKYQ